MISYQSLLFITTAMNDAQAPQAPFNMATSVVSIAFYCAARFWSFWKASMQLK